MLFSDRAEEAIKHNPGLPVKSRPGQVQNYESPDRVYGLKETADFKSLLDGADKRAPVSERSLRDTVEFSPFDPDGEPLLYPFLILEAKSSKGNDNIEAQMQTAFVIRRLLNLQYDLKRAAGEEWQRETEQPLVWFLTWRAEQWNVSAAFIECEPEGKILINILKMVVDLWTGNIRSENGALQLLLIIDHIFEWARDIYRHSIMRDLQKLSTNNVSETDPLYYSMAGRGLMKTTKSSAQPTEILDRGAVENLDFLNIVLPEGVIRDASILESRFLALQLNKDDVGTFLASFNSDDEAAEWTRQILEYQQHAWKVAPGTIQELERISTGNSRTSGQGGHLDEMSFLNLAIHFHVSPTWQLVRQITCISFSEAALNLLISKLGIDREFSHQPQVAIATITNLLHPLFNRSVIDCLTDAVSMVCLSSCVSCTDREESRPMVSAERPEEHYAGLEPTNSPHLITLVTAVYENHRIGRREPSDPYLSFSCRQLRHDKLHPISDDRTSGNLLPFTFAKGQWGILVDAILQEGSPPKRCLYLFGKFSEYEDFAGLLRQMLKESMYTMTKLISIGSWHEGNSRYLNQRISLDDSWKSKADPDSFDKWLRNLEAFWKQHDSTRGHSASSPIIID
ncbi:hypothetical protein F1880_009829 [Penicillium rolfsii]|nr:hypothetical protein F1880_009829 [Penicillium rolfsii]